MVKIVLGDYLESQKIEIKWLHDVTGIRYATLIDYIHNHTGSMKHKHIAKIMKALKINDMNKILRFEHD